MKPGADAILAVAERAARRAASVLTDAARDLARLPASSREHEAIAASARMDAEDAIVATLRGAFPEQAVLGEESGHIAGARDVAGTRWIVEPIDGSVNFLHGFPHYAISLARAQGAQVTHAVVLDPVRDELFSAIDGQGAYCNGTPLRVSACRRLADALVGTAIPDPSDPRYAAYLPVFQSLTGRCASLRNSGTCTLDFANLAAGRLDGMWVTTLNPWDAAAGVLLIREAGGRVGDLAGSTDCLRANEILAAAPGLFNFLREALASQIDSR